MMPIDKRVVETYFKSFFMARINVLAHQVATVLSIGDFDANNREFSNLVDYRFADAVNNTNVQNTGYLKALALSKGFLSYRDLLKIYLSEDENPNLFYFFCIAQWQAEIDHHTHHYHSYSDKLLK